MRKTIDSFFPVQWENISDFETGSTDSRGAIYCGKSYRDC